MARRIVHLTLDTLGDLPDACRTCLFWELDPVRRRAVAEPGCEKESWVSHVLLEWGSCGRVAYVDGEPAGYVLYAPPSYLPGSEAFPTAPVSPDAVLLATAWVDPAFGEVGLGRHLVRAAARDLVDRGGIAAIEAFGTAGSTGGRAAGATGAATGTCLVPADFLARVGFKTHRPHPRTPRMRLDLKAAISWREEVESALGRLLGGLRPHPAPATDPVPRQR